MENETENKRRDRLRRLLARCKELIVLLLNPRFVLCVAVAWLITNGWAYIGLGMGSYFGIGWLVGVSTAYLAFLWIPFTPEKIVTLAIAIFLLRLFFPNDQKTLAHLHNLSVRTKEKWREWKAHRKKEK